MGFYAPAQIVRDARDHGVEIRAVDINHSLWDNTLERDARGALALRLGFRQVDGLQEAEAHRLVAKRSTGYATIEDLARRVRLQARSLRLLADADAFGSIGLDRRAALWAIRRVPDDAPLPLFAAADAPELAPEPAITLPAMALGEQVAADYQTLRLSLKAHPMAILRPVLDRERILSCGAANDVADGRFVRNAGLVLVRQRPGKGNAIFVTIEDETGITNLVLWARLFEQYRREVMAARLMLVEGRIQRSRKGWFTSWRAGSSTAHRCWTSFPPFTGPISRSPGPMNSCGHRFRAGHMPGETVTRGMSGSSRNHGTFIERWWAIMIALVMPAPLLVMPALGAGIHDLPT